MPLTIPPFVQYQEPMFPLRGLWHVPPPEGDFFITAEIQWQVTTGATSAVQFSVSGNSPVALSQIAALYVDNSRCGSDVGFLFPDSAFQLIVPAYTQGLYPVLTNATMFYAQGMFTEAGDITIFQICNSIPPPVSITPPTPEQSFAGIAAEPFLAAGGTVQLVAAGTNGTLEGFNIIATVATPPATPQVVGVSITDGAGATLWYGVLAFSAGQTTTTIDLSGLRLRFTNGLALNVSPSSLSGDVTANVYFSVP